MFVGWFGGRFRFEFAIFGADDCSGAGVSRVGEKFDMVVGDLKTSAFAGGEPAGAERSCQLVDTCDVKLCDVASWVKGARVFIGC